MKFLVLLLVFILVGVATSRMVSLDTINKLEEILREYKSTEDEKSKSVEDANNSAEKMQTGKKCVESSREALKECVTKSLTKSGEKECARLFINSYTGCFFDKQNSAKKASACKCLNRYDNCVLFATPVEVFLCKSKRRNCFSTCKRPNDEVNDVEVTKRTSCKSDCAGETEVCMRVITAFAENIICVMNEVTCRKECKGSS